MQKTKRVTFKTQYNENAGYVSSRKITAGKYKNEIIVLYKAKEAGMGDKGYIIVNETRSLMGPAAKNSKEAYELLRDLASGTDYIF